MTLPTVSPDDVARRYDGDLSEFRQEYVEQQIEDVTDFITSRWSGLVQARLDGGTLTDNLYRRVVADAVLRIIRNPSGYRSENEGGYGYSQDAKVASGMLGFSQDDIDTLIGASSSVGPGSFGVGLDVGWG